MDKKQIRLTEPVLTIKQIPKKINRRKEKYRLRSKINKTLGIKSNNINIPYSELTEDKREKLITSTAKAITRKVKISPRFANERARITRTGMAKVWNRVKTCTLCNVERGITDFDYVKSPQHKPKVRRSYCRFCRRKMNKEAYLRRKEKKNDSM